MDYAVRIHEVSKRYRIGARRDPRNFRETLADTLLGPFRRTSDEDEEREREQRTLWALRDVSFDIPHGEAIAVIGQNGAGKSTLLKILSRITEPTSGRIEITGRVASLLEVGTGFHGELTGRENVQLNGAILGMKRQEVRARFDEIVAFAGVERFIDTPVKYYSSGMYMRLAFAVAAHLEPDILVVDEVLAVGDASFQAKCLGKMEDVATHGRTVIFVSHNMPAVRALCRNAVWLQEGRILTAGDAPDVVNQYLRHSISRAAVEDLDQRIAGLPEDPAFRLLRLDLVQNGERAVTVGNGDPLDLVIDYDVKTPIRGLHFNLRLYDMDEVLILESLSHSEEPGLGLTDAGSYRSTVTIPADLLAARTYRLRLSAGIATVRDLMPMAIQFNIDVLQTGIVNRAYAGYSTPARIAPLFEWSTMPVGRGEIV